MYRTQSLTDCSLLSVVRHSYRCDIICQLILVKNMKINYHCLFRFGIIIDNWCMYDIVQISVKLKKLSENRPFFVMNRINGELKRKPVQTTTDPCCCLESIGMTSDWPASSGSAVVTSLWRRWCHVHSSVWLTTQLSVRSSTGHCRPVLSACLAGCCRTHCACVHNASSSVPVCDAVRRPRPEAV